MNATDIIGWTFDGAMFCTDHKPSEGADPIFASDEIEPLDACDTCLSTWISANPGKNAADERAHVLIDQAGAESWLADRDCYLEDFTQGYVECALWCGIDSEDGVETPEGDEDDLSDAALAEMASDCKDFVRAQYDDLADLDASQCGHDFYLTRNRHGVGFWDRGLGAKGKRLTDAAHVYGTQGMGMGRGRGMGTGTGRGRGMGTGVGGCLKCSQTVKEYTKWSQKISNSKLSPRTCNWSRASILLAP